MTTRKDIYDDGYERGWNVASWIDVPEIGSQVPLDLDWEGLDIVTDDNLADVMALHAYHAEENGRSFSPFEFTARDLNELEETADFEVWEAYEEGIEDGIRAEIRSRLAPERTTS